MGMNAWGEDISLAGLLSIGVMIIGIYCLMMLLEPIREVPIHDEKFAARRLSMMRIMARRTNAATVVA